LSAGSFTPSPVAAKLARPRIDDVVLRPDSLAEFRRATRRRLSLVCAPAGYGKTTVAAAATERLGLESIWYKLDVLDHDPVVFLESLTEALRERFADFGDAIRERLRTTAETPFPIEHMQAMFVTECDRRIDRDVHIVLDDYHEAAESTELNRTLDYLLADLPASLRFIVLTRYDPAFSVNKMRLAGEVSAIGAETLRFDVEQAVAVLAARIGHQPRREHIERLVALTEGWPASIVLAGLALEWLDLDSLELVLSDPRLKQDIYSYLAEQVYRREDEAIRSFLKRTCCLENINAELANRLAGTDAAHRYLAHLAANRVFTFATGVEGAYRYHNLFRDFLRQRYLQEEGEPAFRRLQHETAAALEDVGETEMAVELYLNANQPLDALGVVARGGEAGLEGLPSERLRSWLDRLPPAAGATEPWARLMAGQFRSRDGDYDEALREIDRAARSFEAAADEWGLYHALSMRECALFWQGDTDEALRACQAALAHAQTDQQKMHTLLGLGSAALDMRRWEEAEAAFAAADAVADLATPAEQIRARALRAHAAYYRGDFRAARAALPAPEPEDTSGAFRATILNTGGAVELGLADYAQALALFEQARAVAERCGYTLTADMVADNIGLLRGAQGRVAEGLAIVRKTMEGTAFAEEPTLMAFGLSHEATLLRRAGDLEAALAPCTKAAESVTFERDPYIALNSQANLLYLRALLGDKDTSQLLAISRRASGAGLSFVALKAQLYAAVVARTTGDGELGAELLRDCVPRQLTLGHLHLLAQELCPRPTVAAVALASASSQDLVQRLMDALANHWSFAGLVEALVADTPAQAVPAVRAAAERASDDVLARVLAATQGTSGGALARAVETALEQRPGVSFVPGPVFPELTKRERQILRLMAEGRRNLEIADELFLSPFTVKTHVNHIFSKLGAKSRIQAVLAFKEAAGQASDRP
jgi:ATP/maltotriose-dependent transcriptional regulator MalT